MDSGNNENQFGSSTMSTECREVTKCAFTSKDLIARRSDLSTFIVHLTRDEENGETAIEHLKSIIRDLTIEARNMYGAARARFNDLKDEEGVVITSADEESQKVVCFTETPLQYLHLMMKKIDGRKFKFGPYGIGVTKSVARENGVNPVWYLDISPGHNWLTSPVNSLIDSAIKSSAKFSKSDIAAIAPFIEQMGIGIKKYDGVPYRKEFWWEREWRHKGNFKLPNHVLIICPEDEKSTFEQIVNDANLLSAESNGNRLSAEYIDATWGLEQVIAKLAGF